MNTSRRTAAALLTLSGLACGCLAQTTQPPGGQAFDIGSVGRAQPGEEAPSVTPAPQEPAEAVIQPAGSRFYPVSRFVPEYVGEHPQHPALDDIMGAPLTLGLTPNGYTSPGQGERDTTIRLRDITAGNAGYFNAGALSSVGRALVKELDRRGVNGVMVLLHPDEIDTASGNDLRKTGREDLRLMIVTGVVGDVRTVASGRRLAQRIEEGLQPRVNATDRVSTRIREQSPVIPGDLFDAKAVDDYAFRLGRHPGRRVDVAVAPGSKEREIAVDYLVQEERPWRLYAQLSNTGTEATDEWRQRFGFVHNQLTGRDDILRVDFITAAFDNTNALLASYDFPIRSENLRAKVYGSWSEYDASDVGLPGENFNGRNYRLGAELVRNVYQDRQLFVDAVLGARYDSVRVNNTLFDERGQESYITPYIGARLERVRDVKSTFASVSLEAQFGDLSSVDSAELSRLGRLRPDDDWVVLRFDAAHNFYIEPLISGVFKGTSDKGPTTLAHEIALSLRGQYSFDSRLIPTEQEVAGGLYTVRGYDESLVAGDNAAIASVEYRYHIPQAWKPGPPGMLGNRRMRTFGENFRWQPQEAFGRADWDLIAKGFLDAGVTGIVDSSAAESGETLVGAGVGLELQYKTNVSMRLEWGVALADVDRPGDDVDAGDNRVHFLLSIVY
jgi:hemolysin activation/secretion protein